MKLEDLKIWLVGIACFIVIIIILFNGIQTMDIFLLAVGGIGITILVGIIFAIRTAKRNTNSQKSIGDKND